MIREGDFVELTGLKQAKELNGAQGVVLSYDHVKQRYIVDVDKYGQKLLKALKADNLTYVIQDSDDDTDDTDDTDYNDNERPKKKPRLMAKWEAWVDPSFTPETPGAKPINNTQNSQSNNSVDSSIVDKIKKTINLSVHPNTPENEAVQAMRKASNMMREYNLSEQDVLGTSRSIESEGDIVTVCLRRTKDKQGMQILPRWVSLLSEAVAKNFGVKRYVKRNPTRVIFYGIRNNAQLAAFSFSVVFHYTHTRMRVYNNESNCNTAVKRHCYADGISKGILKAVKEEKKEEKKHCYDDTARQDQSLALTIRQDTVADNILMRHGINLIPGKRYSKRTSFNSVAFREGHEDGLNFDLNRRSLK